MGAGRDHGRTRYFRFSAGGGPGGPGRAGIIGAMYLRAGVISMVLLLASRVLGLARESVQAAAFGTTALGDLAVLMLTLPDLATTILASGALAYALLPWWARQAPAALARSQRQAAQLMLAVGLLMALVLWLTPAQVGRWLAPGLGAAAQPDLAQAIHWAALAVPASLLASLWYTRLQHERDVVGMYGMNVVHTGVVIAAMLAVAWRHPAEAITWLGLGLVLALALRLLFLNWRLARVPVASAPADAGSLEDVQGLPHGSIWFWAILATGVPAALPLLARSLVSQSGEGALATFNYAWKLVELPNLLAIQLVAALAFPALTRAQAEGRDFTVQLRSAFMLAWTLACAAALALWVGAVPLAGLLFGWGRMDTLRVAEIAHWAAVGGWTLPGQALVAVAVLVLATVGRLRAAALAYGLVFGGLAALGAAGLQGGLAMMAALSALFGLLALVLLWSVRVQAARALAWREMAVPGLLCVVLAPLASQLRLTAPLLLPSQLPGPAAGELAAQVHAVPALVPLSQSLLLLAVAGLLAVAVLVISYLASPVLRATLRR